MQRIKALANEPGTYHVISRVVAGERLLEPKDREVLRKQMRQMAAFCGVEILTYCILSNHFHLLVWVPPKEEDLPDEVLVRRYAVLYGRDEARVLEENLKSPGLRSGLRAGLLKRMHDLSFFMKELKLRFTLYYNRNHNRFGTLWAEKFKSLLLQSDGNREATLIVAAYIDLNPVRAGLCKDPKNYRFCGYAEAVAGSCEAREGLQSVAPTESWRETARQYRMVLFGAGTVSDRSRQGGIDPEAAKRVLESGGRLPIHQTLRLRLRYFSEGLALGSAEFIDRIKNAHRDFLRNKRPGKPASASFAEEENLFFARRNRKVRDSGPV